MTELLFELDLRTHLVELLCELAFLVSGGILVHDTVAYSLIYLFNGNLVCSLGSDFVTCFNTSVVFFNDGLHLRLEHSVAKVLCLSYLYALLCRFNVRHDFPSFVQLYVTRASERVLPMYTSYIQNYITKHT